MNQEELMFPLNYYDSHFQNKGKGQQSSNVAISTTSSNSITPQNKDVNFKLDYKQLFYKHNKSIHESQKNLNEKSNFKRKFFTKDEDNLLSEIVLSYQESSWNDIAKFISGRTPKQCRDRWMNYLKPSIKFDPWTLQEDLLLVSLVNLFGTHWTRMKSYFPQRSSNSLKNRWYWLIKGRIGYVQTNDILPNTAINSLNCTANYSYQSNSNNYSCSVESKMQYKCNVNQKQKQNKKYYFLLSQTIPDTNYTLNISDNTVQKTSKINNDNSISVNLSTKDIDAENNSNTPEINSLLWDDSILNEIEW